MLKKIRIELKRDNLGFTLKIKTPKDIEDYYKNKNDVEIMESSVWNNNGEPAKFYKISDEYADKEINTICVDNYNATNKYGSRLIESGRINIGILRTVGISKGVSIRSTQFDGYTNTEMELYVKQLGAMVKKMYSELIKKLKVKATVTFEV